MASLIGPGFDQRITNKFAKKVIDGEQITVVGGEQRFGYLDVRDAASGIINVALSDGDWDEIYNLGNDASYTLIDIAQTAVEVGREMGFDAKNIVVADGESASYQNSSLVCQKINSNYSWKAEYDLKETLIGVYIKIKEAD